MATIFPFRALRPRPDLAQAVASVPYDVIDRPEARALAADDAQSFLHVTKPELDLPDSVGSYDEAVYAGGAAALQRMQADGLLVQDTTAGLYLYELTMNGRAQTGFVLCASVPEYDQNLVRKHEHTRPDKENDRVRHMEVAGAQTGTVFLVHRDSDALTEVMQSTVASEPLFDFVTDDGVRHRGWAIAADQVQPTVDGFKALGPIYIADGHHRSASASRVAATQRQAGDAADAVSQQFLAVSFPKSQVKILPYNRVVNDLGERSAVEFLEAVRAIFDVSEGKPEPISPRTYAMYLAGAWYGLKVRDGSYPADDPVRRLDIAILQDQLLAPLLGIEDPRTDNRIAFVGGIRGDAELARRVDAGGGVAFSVHATSLDDLFAVADAETVMPPKSTWFEPKLRDGLFVHVIR